MTLHLPHSNPAAAASPFNAEGVDTMLDEGGRLPTGKRRHTARVRNALSETVLAWLQGRNDDTPAGHLAGLIKGALSARFGGRHMHRNETHMNRGAGRIWWYWPALATTAVIAIGTVIFVVSASGVGAGISLMLRELI
jgi:hypothetical protein